MAIIGGPRFYGGRRPESSGYKWTCKSCGTEHLTRMEDGCPSCGAGTPEMIAKAQVPPTIPVERLCDACVADVEIAPRYWLTLPGLSPAARLSIAVALAAYAEQGPAPSQEELPRQVSLRWAQWLFEQIEAGTIGAAGGGLPVEPAAPPAPPPDENPFNL